MIHPILVGPRAKIEAVAEQLELDISRFELVEAPHSHAAAARRCSRSPRRAEALMKGSLHTDELLGAGGQRDTGLRTARRLSHCFVLDVPTYQGALIISDAAVNIAPTLEEKVDIVQNAIDLGHALRLPEVRVAIMSAIETVNSKIPSTVEAGALCKESPTAIRSRAGSSTAPSPATTRSAGGGGDQEDPSPVAAGERVIVPNLEAGDVLAKASRCWRTPTPRGSSCGRRFQWS